MANRTIVIEFLGKDVSASKAAAEVETKFSHMGSALGKVGHAAGTAFKVGAVATIGAAGSLIGAALFKGFDRLNNIDQAKAKLSGLGHSAGEVGKIMGSALASVKGTAYGLDEAATVAASAVASGVKPGQDLQRTLSLVADAATIGGTSMAEMGSIFNKVSASGKIQGDVIAQLGDRGIPILQLLGKQLGKTPAQVSDLASKGKIDFATFQDAMQAGLGGAALKSGQTFSGAMANVGASVSRIGAGLLGGIFPHLAPMFAGITVALAPLEGKATQVGNAIGKALGPALENVGPFLQHMTTAIAHFDFSKLAQGGGTLANLGDSLKTLGGALKNVDFGALAKGLGQGAADTVSVFSVVIGFAADHVDTLAKALPALVVAFAAYKTAQAAANVLALVHVPLTSAQIVSNFALASSNRQLAAQMAITNSVERVGMIARARATIATVAGTVAMIATSAATKVAAAGQWLLNAALSANPIGLVVIAVAALVGGLIYAYKHSEKFRVIVDKAFKAVQKAAAFAWTWIKAHWPLLLAIITGPIGLAVLFIAKHWKTIKAGAALVVTWITTKWSGLIAWFKAAPGKLAAATRTLWDGIKTAFRAALNWVIDKWNALSFTIPSVTVAGKTFGGKTINTPNISRIATGGIVSARSGGILANIAEGGHDEAVTPLDGPHAPWWIKNGPGGGGDIHITVELDSEVVHRALVRRKRNLGRELGLA